MNEKPSSQAPHNSYPTAQPSPDALGLGRTSGQRGAEILAGLRAELLPSPVTQALTRFGGQVTARLIMKMEKNKASLNFVAARLEGITELVRRSLPQSDHLVLVDIAAGFSPRGWQLAQKFPQARVIEVDLPDVVRDKQTRLQKAKAVTFPANLEWRDADLGVTPLVDVLDGEKVDVISAEGLNAYFKAEDITRIAAQIRACLKPGGVYISDIPWTTGMHEAMVATRFFSRQAGVYKGVMDSAETMEKLMLNAGYAEAKVYRPSVIAAEIGLPTPVLDFSFFVVARNGEH